MRPLPTLPIPTGVLRRVSVSSFELIEEIIMTCCNMVDQGTKCCLVSVNTSLMECWGESARNDALPPTDAGMSLAPAAVVDSPLTWK